MTALDNQNPVGSGSQKLSQLLASIEEHAKGCGGRGYYIVPNRNTGEPEQEQCRICLEQPDLEERLVKALRRAMEFLQWALAKDEGLLEHRQAQLAAILEDRADVGEEKADLEERGAE